VLRGRQQRHARATAAGFEHAARGQRVHHDGSVHWRLGVDRGHVCDDGSIDHARIGGIGRIGRIGDPHDRGVGEHHDVSAGDVHGEHLRTVHAGVGHVAAGISGAVRGIGAGGVCAGLRGVGRGVPIAREAERGGAPGEAEREGEDAGGWGHGRCSVGCRVYIIRKP
jgi:hypothetical protein